MLRSLALTGVAVLLGAVAGCGGGGDTSQQADSGAASTEEYCSALKNAQREFQALQGQGSAPDLQKAFQRVQGLADKAPPAVADEWAKVDGNISTMEKALTEAGLGFNDLVDPRAIQGLSKQQQQRLQQQLQGLGGPEFDRANRQIQQHAKKECGIDLSQNR